MWMYPNVTFHSSLFYTISSTHKTTMLGSIPVIHVWIENLHRKNPYTEYNTAQNQYNTDRATRDKTILYQLNLLQYTKNTLIESRLCFRHRYLTFFIQLLLHAWILDTIQKFHSRWSLEVKIRYHRGRASSAPPSIAPVEKWNNENKWFKRAILCIERCERSD